MALARRRECRATSDRRTQVIDVLKITLRRAQETTNCCDDVLAESQYHVRQNRRAHLHQLRKSCPKPKPPIALWRRLVPANYGSLRGRWSTRQLGTRASA